MNQSTPEDVLLRNFYQNNTNGSIGKFTEINDHIGSGNMQQALSINSSINDTCKIESFQKTVNEIFVGNLYSKNQINSSQLRQLRIIANTCPMLGGRAVFGARTILRLFGENEFNDNCPAPSLRAKFEDETFQSDNNIPCCKIYPNPNDGKMNLDYSLSENENGLFIIKDITGRKVAEYTLSHGEYTLSVSEAALQNGIYFYQVMINGKIVSSDKLSIVK